MGVRCERFNVESQTGFLGVQYYLMENVPRHLMCSKV